jgi:hypothetical protein
MRLEESAESRSFRPNVAAAAIIFALAALTLILIAQLGHTS